MKCPEQATQWKTSEDEQSVNDWHRRHIRIFFASCQDEKVLTINILLFFFVLVVDLFKGTKNAYLLLPIISIQLVYLNFFIRKFEFLVKTNCCSRFILNHCDCFYFIYFLFYFLSSSELVLTSNHFLNICRVWMSFQYWLKCSDRWCTCRKPIQGNWR